MNRPYLECGICGSTELCDDCIQTYEEEKKNRRINISSGEDCFVSEAACIISLFEEMEESL